ncbi:MAG: oxygenase MpaB family protein [Acidimicrobiia bacterium]
MGFADSVRRRVISAATSPFAHVSYPLADSLDYRGDPGLFGPGSVSWRVLGDVSTFIGGIRALLVQAAHPEVVAGVEDHSRYREDPLGRLSRTSAYVNASTYGAMPEVKAAVEKVHRVHRPIKGTSHRGLPYTADEIDLSAWVHNALTDSFLTAYQVFGPEPLDRADADRFVVEQAKIGALFDSDPMPVTAADLAAWIAGHPQLAPSPGMKDAVDFLVRPPLPSAGQRLGYRLMQAAAVATLPGRLQDVLGVHGRWGAVSAVRPLIGSLRWALGMSPSWNLALVRVGADVPPGLFRQPLPVPGAGATGRPR